MTLHISISPEVEGKLRERAATIGKDPAAVVLQVVEDELAGDEPSPPAGQHLKASAEQRISALHAWAASHAPLPYEADDSRESIYEGRDE